MGLFFHQFLVCTDTPFVLQLQILLRPSVLGKAIVVQYQLVNQNVGVDQRIPKTRMHSWGISCIISLFTSSSSLLYDRLPKEVTFFVISAPPINLHFGLLPEPHPLI